jgi:serine/threonine-protein kinase
VVKLADFGIARATDQSSITQVGSVLGTAAYLAPEQAHGEEAGPRSDLYSLGVVTYQLMSGRLPYEANSLTELALMQQREAPPLLHEIAPDVSPQLAAAVDRALSLDPNERYANAEEMRAALVDGARGVGPLPSEETGATAVATASTRVSRPATAEHETPQRRLQPSAPRHPPPAPLPPEAVPERRRRTGVRNALIWLLVLGLVIAGIVIALSAGGSKRTVHLRSVTGQDAHQTIDKVQQLIDDNTG